MTLEKERKSNPQQSEYKRQPEAPIDLPRLLIDEKNTKLNIDTRTVTFEEGEKQWDYFIFLARSRMGRTFEEIHERFPNNASANLNSNLRRKLDYGLNTNFIISERNKGCRLHGIIEFKGEEPYIQEFPESSGKFYSVPSKPKSEQTIFTKEAQDKKTPRDLFCDATKRVLSFVLQGGKLSHNPFELMRKDITDFQVRRDILEESEGFEEAQQKIVAMVMTTTARIWGEPTEEMLSRSEHETREVAQQLQKAGFDLPKIQDIIQAHFKTGSDEE